MSSRQLTTFSDIRQPASGDFFSTDEYVQYLNEFCSNFDLWPEIELNTEVIQVTRRYSGHRVKYISPLGEAHWDCDAVAICSGLHVKVNLPNIHGLEHVGRVLHSSEFKSSKQFKGHRTIVVIGAGETGADISYLASNTPGVERVVLCHKDGVHFAPKVSLQHHNTNRLSRYVSATPVRSFCHSCAAVRMPENPGSLSMSAVLMLLTLPMYTKF